MLDSPYIQPVKKRSMGLYNDEGIMRKLALAVHGAGRPAIMFTNIVGYTALLEKMGLD